MGQAVAAAGKDRHKNTASVSGFTILVSVYLAVHKTIPQP